MPSRPREMVTPCLDGYTIYINEKLGPEARMEAYKHALKHIEADDFSTEDVQEVETRAHTLH